MTDARVSYEIDAGIATLTLDDGKANALSHAMIEDIGAALDRAESEAEAVILAGRPGRFSAGFDLKVMMSGPDAARGLVRAGAELLLRIYALPQPVVIACTGHAVAGGALLVLCGDTRLGIEGDFKLGLNEVAIGLTMPILAQELARDRLDPRYLTAATIQSRMFSPREAVDAGYLDRVVAPEALAEAARTEATALAKLPAAALAATKRRLRAPMIDHVRATLEADLAALVPPAG